MAWNQKEYELSKSGFSLPTMEGEQGLKDRLREEEAKRKRDALDAELRRADHQAQLAKAKKKADAKAAKKQRDQDRKAERKAEKSDRRAERDRAPASVKFKPEPIRLSGGASSSGDGGGWWAALGVFMVVSVIAAFVQWVHGKVAATLAIAGLTGVWPAAIVMGLTIVLAAIAAIIAYHNDLIGRRVWTKKVAWTAIPALALAAFIVISSFL